jgi:hypothetical protein
MVVRTVGELARIGDADFGLRGELRRRAAMPMTKEKMIAA